MTQPDAHDDSGHQIYFNGSFKWMVSAVVVAMWGLLVLMSTGFANEMKKKIEENKKDIVEIKIGFAQIKQKIDGNREILEEIKREVRRNNSN